jgi:hypothetical protein
MSTFRKILTTGVGAALMTESSIRNALSDIKLTGQARDYIARQVQRGWEEATKMLIGELKKILEHVDLPTELQKTLSGLSLEIEATITIKPKGSGRSSEKDSIRRFKIKKV